MNSNNLIGLSNNSDEETVEEFSISTQSESIYKENRGDVKKYFFSETFASLELAKKAINEEDSCAYKCKKEEKKTGQTKIFYRCKKMTQLNPIQCSTGALLILKSKSHEVEIHKTLSAHYNIPRIFLLVYKLGQKLKICLK